MTRNVALFVPYDDVTCAMIIFLSPQGRKSASIARVTNPVPRGQCASLLSARAPTPECPLRRPSPSESVVSLTF